MFAVAGLAVAGLGGCSSTSRSAPSDAGSADARHDAGDVAASCAGKPCPGACVANRCLVTLATSPSPNALALDGTYAYFTSCTPDGGGLVDKVALEGGPLIELATTSGCPTSLVVGDDGAYVGLTGSGVVRVPLAGGAPAAVAASTDAPIGIALDGESVYFTTPGALWQAPRRGGTATPLATSSDETAPTRPVLDGDDVFWGDRVDGTIRRVSKQGGAAVALGPRAATVRDIALLGSDVYFAGGYIVQNVPTAGGTPTTLGTADGAEIITLVADEAGVYFSSSGALWKLPLVGGAAVALASDEGEPVAMAVDATSVYWVSRKPDGDPRSCCGHLAKLTGK